MGAMKARKTTCGLRCCEGCGRDTYGRYCRECIGPPIHSDVRGAPLPEGPLEDDYGDESDADSVCDDNPEHPTGRWEQRW